jgi:hypothetical protein
MTEAEKETDRSLLKDGQLMDRHWESAGQELRRRWTGTVSVVEWSLVRDEQLVDRSWVGGGQELGRRWTGAW